MATEKIPLNSLQPILVSLPGGIHVYDSTGASKTLSKPIVMTELQKQGIESVSKEELETQGVRIVSTKDGLRIQMVYPKTKQSLLSFQGTLPALTYIFTNPSEDPSKQRQELTTEVYQTLEDIVFSDAEPKTVSVRHLSDGVSVEIPRLGHLIARLGPVASQQAFPPNDLRLYLPPVHIPSQHLGDCAADTMQTALFFADGFQEEFAELANTLYKKHIRTEPQVLFGVDNPKLKQEVVDAYRLADSLPQQKEDTVSVFANMIRRYILVRLLDFGTEEEIATLPIPSTSCLLQSAVPKMGVVRQRRKSVNLLAGATIARKLSRIFEPSSMLSSDLKLKESEIHLLLEHTFFCTLFLLLKRPQFHSLIWRVGVPFTFDTSMIRAILFPLLQTKQNSGASSLEGGGHSISVFRFQEEWYLQDDNIGIAKPIPSFDLEEYVSKKSEFFISTYRNLRNKSDLIEQGFFTEEELRKGNGLRYVYYGYKYMNGLYPKEKIVHKASVGYAGRYDSGQAALYLCVGDLTAAQKAPAMFSCGEVSSDEITKPTTKEFPKVKNLSPEILEQMNIPTGVSKSTARPAPSFPALRRNIQANLNRFTNTRKANAAPKAANNNTRRRFKAYTNAKILNQFTAF
jgi:hypothetical protein